MSETQEITNKQTVQIQEGNGFTEINQSSLNNKKNFVICIVGSNGTGKTTIEKEIAQEWKSLRPEGKVVSFDIYNQFTEISDYNIKLEKTWANSIDDKARNSLVILDDYKLLADGYTPTEGMKDLLINRGRHNNDYIFSCHSPSDIMNALHPFITHYYIFSTRNSNSRFKQEIPNGDKLLTASNLVNSYVNVNGIGKHKKDTSYDGQWFPFATIDTYAKSEDTIKLFNMNKPFLQDNTNATNDHGENVTPKEQDQKQPVPEKQTPIINLFDAPTEEVDYSKAGGELLGGAEELFSTLKQHHSKNPNQIDQRNKMMINMATNLVGNIPEKIKLKLLFYVTILFYFVVLGFIQCITYALNFPEPSSYLSLAVLGYIVYQILRTTYTNIIYKKLFKDK